MSDILQVFGKQFQAIIIFEGSSFLTLYFRHIQAYSRLIQLYLVLLSTYKPLHSKEHSLSAILGHILNAIHNIQADSSIFRFLAYLGMLCFRHIQPYSQCQTSWGIFSHIRVYFGRFRHIQNSLAQIGIFMYIMTYSEPMAYFGIFRTIDICTQFQARCSGITQEQFKLILNLIQADSRIFETLAYLDL